MKNQEKRTHVRTYSPFPKDGEILLRDKQGECYRARLVDGNFVWVEIDPEVFQAANESRFKK
jgi:hypothetical protein